ncbi:toll-like receptor 1 [Cololabis saira]|uniref:toll-like receptor 1 n=1 Tax=Cololabis saira TaxID=129043 RepID=UPI002AD3A535|nr:toll-like receptor 1 [Cololabis saira]
MRLSAAVLWGVAVLVGSQKCAAIPDNFVDRSSRNLSSVPTDLPKTAESVDLSRNHIHHLHKGDFENTTLLKALNVSWNGLELIDGGTFLDTPLLEYLDLSHNRLTNLSGQEYLLNTRNLVALNLSWNEFAHMKLGIEFSLLVNLEKLTLGGKNISLGDFKNIAGVKLHSLTLSLQEELDYEAGSLRDVQAQRLQTVFSSDQAVDSNLIADALSCFVEVEIKNLTGSYEKITEQLSEKADIRTNHILVTTWVVDWIDLTDLVNAVLRTSITHLTSTDIAISRPPYHDTYVTETSHMETFIITRGVVKSFFFSQEALYNYFINMPVKSLTCNETFLIYMTCPKKQSPIVHLDFSYCALSDSIFSRVVDEHTVECDTLSNLTTLSLMSNNVKNLFVLSNRLQHMMSLQHLDLSVNSLVVPKLPDDKNTTRKCLWPPNITIMNLSSGGLTDLVFNCLPEGVQTLDLQNNQISVVPAEIIFTLKNLSSLNLNSNRLRDLPVCNYFPILNELLLMSNSLHAPSVNSLQSCPNLKTLDVSRNPFTCTCPLRDFIRFCRRAENKGSTSHIELLSWPLGYNCTYPEDVRDTTLRDFWISEISCNAKLLAAVILVPAVTVIITVLLLCHCLDVPWYMGMIWQWTRAKHRARKQQLRPEDLVGVEFHAFVSYSQQDAEWVTDSLLPNLEGPAGGLRICHHEKSFVPGKSIIENIISCVEKSRRSVFVLSASFVKSEWCHYELYFASHQRLSLGLDSIVLVLLEPLPQYLIPSKYYQLKSMMSRHTYLEWPQDKAKHRLFWANLRAALQTNLPNAPEAEILD